MVRPGTWMLEVGLKATCTSRGWPVEMPPSMPPALLLSEAAGREFVAMLAAALCDGWRRPHRSRRP